MKKIICPNEHSHHIAVFQETTIRRRHRQRDGPTCHALSGLGAQILAGQVRGRVVVDVNR
jgi:hypothetical protein